jgi:hypothetical protein
LLLGTLLLRAIQAESYWNGHPAISELLISAKRRKVTF